MTISSALSNALSGLNASSRMADTVSANIANVLTEGFAPRQVALESRQNGGVSIVGVTRFVDTALLGDRRLADSAQAAAETRSDFALSLERMIGTPGDEGAFSTRLATFETSLISAAARPEEPNRLQSVVDAASALSANVNAVSDGIQDLRSRADAEIAATVDTLNTVLDSVATLNRQITQATANGRATAGLEDQRQAAIDDIAQIVPLRQLPRDNGAVALVTTGGAVLLDGRAAHLEFDASRIVAPHMTRENGLLSGIRIAGQEISLDDPGPLSGGKLAALFQNRDVAATEAQSGLDAIARDFIERFSQPGLDPTQAPGTPGLFTDAGSALDPATETGLASRLAINPLVDPQSGGVVSRLRDGLGATESGPPGNADLLQRMGDALTSRSSLGPESAIRDASGHIADFASRLAQDRLTTERELSFGTSQANELRSLELENGVDSDAELQRLLLVEQAFAANARLVQTIDDLMQTLLRIGA
ncbi:flagellar hook-associated protein 1 [Roseovarius sp. A-2]|uniref:flagellar hook-associated protein FlgK n=1 Tax=Roseovarius sp. A-2 TaxID=1570360 RepID=UPI0009B550B7|nr:flagellar hook-associated protein FlgK [Roseovarius sp. A-2]GAW34071.1 flagellar hook-associated protein 1 [Roseovarius sp. A-2]